MDPEPIAATVLDTRTDAENGAVSADFTAIGTSVRIVVTDPGTLEAATAVAKHHLAQLDACASRFRDDTELSHLNAKAANGPVEVQLSPMLGDSLAAALRAARLTDGLVDPTIGSALIQQGYDRDLAAIRAAGPRRGSGGGKPGAISWRELSYDAQTRCLAMPQGTVLDLGATGKAHAADRIASLLANQHSENASAGFMVDLGGDIATAGTVPDDGWQVGVQDWTGQVRQVVSLRGQAVTTSSMMLRAWTMDDEPRHHIIDPRTGRSAGAVWAQVTVAAATAVEANAASTAAMILGGDAPRWLITRGLPARLDAHPSSGWPVSVLTPGWPR